MKAPPSNGPDGPGNWSARWVFSRSCYSNREPRGRLELPREHGTAWSGGDTAWVIEPDEFDVPWLVRYRIEGAE